MCLGRNEGGGRIPSFFSNHSWSSGTVLSELQGNWLTIASRFPDVEDIKIICIDLTMRGGRAAARVIEVNQAKVSQNNDVPKP